MRTDSLRISLRKLLIIGALLGVILGISAHLHQPSLAFRQISHEHTRKAKSATDTHWWIARTPRQFGQTPEDYDQELDHFARLRTFHQSQVAKYSTAANRPWLPVPPDPSPPPQVFIWGE